MSWECACGISNVDSKDKCGGCGWDKAESDAYKAKKSVEQGGLPDNRVICKTCGNVASALSPPNFNPLFIIGYIIWIVICIVVWDQADRMNRVAAIMSRTSYSSSTTWLTICILFPAIYYQINKRIKSTPKCKSCSSKELIPVTSPAGKQLMDQYHK